MLAKDDNYIEGMDILSKFSDIKFYKEAMFFIHRIPPQILTENSQRMYYTKDRQTAPGIVVDELFFNNTTSDIDQDIVKIDLRDGEPKLFIHAECGIYHFFIDMMVRIIFFNKQYPDATIIIDYSDAEMHENGHQFNGFLKFLKEYLNINNIKHKFLTKNYLVAMDNFYLINILQFTDVGIQMLYDEARKIMGNESTNPFRKVYLSRKYSREPRIKDEDFLEKFLKTKGFDIVYPEQFKNFKDQMNYFSHVHTLMSTTSSGLINSIFMPPGGRVVEFISPLISNQIGLSQIHSSQYLYISYSKNHHYYGIPSRNNSHDLVEYLKNKNL